MSTPPWLSRYIGIPFAETGSTFAGCNCWGLARLVLGNEAGIAVPPYEDIEAKELIAAAREFRDAILTPMWRKVEAPKLFDCVLMSAMDDEAKHRLPGHVGVAVSSDRVLHVWRETSSVHMPLSHPRIRYRVLGFYRHQELE